MIQIHDLTADYHSKTSTSSIGSITSKSGESLCAKCNCRLNVNEENIFEDRVSNLSLKGADDGGGGLIFHRQSLSSYSLSDMWADESPVSKVEY